VKITKENLTKIIKEVVSEVIAEGMPSSVIKSKQRLADMTDEEFAEKYGDKSEEQLRQMAWRHGYGKMSPHYWNRVQKGKKKEETLNSDFLSPNATKELEREKEVRKKRKKELKKEQ
jgi:hypothetical protein